MPTIAAMFDTRSHAEDAIERLESIGCDRASICFLPDAELEEIATDGTYDWRSDKWGLWRALARFGFGDHDRFSLAEGMNRGGAVLLVAADDAMEDRVSNVLVEAGAVDLNEREARWRDAGWMGVSGDGTFQLSPPKLEKAKKLVKAF